MKDYSDKKPEPSKYGKLLPYAALSVCLFLTIFVWRLSDNAGMERERNRYTEYAAMIALAVN